MSRAKLTLIVWYGPRGCNFVPLHTYDTYDTTLPYLYSISYQHRKSGWPKNRDSHLLLFFGAGGPNGLQHGQWPMGPAALSVQPRLCQGPDLVLGAERELSHVNL